MQSSSGARGQGKNGRACRDARGGDRGQALAPDLVRGRKNRDQPLLRHGLAVGLEGCCWGTIDRRGAWRARPTKFLEIVLPGSHPEFAKFWGPLVGPFIAIISFVCSVGNVPLAAVLWNSGISFGGVIAFIFGDLIVIPVLDIYRKYYGLRMSAFILATFCISMALAALGVESLFQAVKLVPSERHAQIVEASISLNYTAILNIVFFGDGGSVGDPVPEDRRP